MKKLSILISIFAIALAVLFINGFYVVAEEGVNGENSENEELEKIEGDVMDLEEQENRLKRMEEVITDLLRGLEEDAPQREALLQVQERAKNIKERVMVRLEEAREKRELAEQNQRLLTMRETIEGLLDRAGEGAKNALESVMERTEMIQERIKERINR